MPKPPPPGGAAGAPVMPSSVRVAVVVMAVLAVLLLANGALLGIGFDVAVDRIVADGDGVTRGEAERFVVLSLVPYLLLGVVLALAAVFLPRGRTWARVAGLTAAVVLGLLTLVSVLASGGVTVASLLLLVLVVALVTSLVARTTRAWLSGTDPGQPAQRG